MEEVYCTLVLTDGYLPGAQVLAHSLRAGGTTRKLAVLISDEGLSEGTTRELERVYDYVIPVPRIYNKHPGNLMLLGRLELGMTFTKIKLWSLLQFSKIVYLDADVLALEAPDELFNTEAAFAACPDVGWPDCFNSGVMVLSPDMGTYRGLLNLAERGLSFDGADQGLLNMHFRSWHRLPFIYNVTPSASYQYAPAYRHYGSNIRMVHFIGADKPWQQKRLSETNSTPASYGDLVSRWWAMWDMHYRPLSEQDPAVVARAASQIGMPTQRRASQQEQAAISARPTEYDPNFRRDHTSHDGAPQPAAASWQPPPRVGEVQEAKKEPKQKIWQPPAFNPPTFQHHAPREEQSRRPYVPPIYLPKETVPYVPREMPYSMYSQTQTPETAYHHPQEYQRSHARYPQFPPPPAYHKQHDSSQGQQQAAQTVHRRFSIEDIQERFDKSLPLPPTLKTVEEGNESRDDHRPFFVEDGPQIAPPASSVKEPLVGPESPVDIRIESEDEWTSYSLVNAWDNDPEIHRYVESFQKFTLPGRRSGNITPKPVFRVGDLTVRDGAVEGEPDVIPPQLPVTPNPVRARGSWRTNILNDEAKYPSAPGIPNQNDWNPLRQLEELKNAPTMMLQKRSPPSPSSVGLGSPRSPGELLVSSSVPVPQLPHMITAHIEGHRRASLLAQQQISGSPTTSDYSLQVGQPLTSAIRPIARRSSAMQTELPEVSNKSAQCSEDDFVPNGNEVTMPNTVDAAA